MLRVLRWLKILDSPDPYGLRSHVLVVAEGVGLPLGHSAGAPRSLAAQFCQSYTMSVVSRSSPIWLVLSRQANRAHDKNHDASQAQFLHIGLNVTDTNRLAGV
jgi:hypothetical protein